MDANSNNEKKMKKGNKFKVLSEEDFNKQLKKQVNGLMKIFEEKDKKSIDDDGER